MVFNTVLNNKNVSAVVAVLLLAVGVLFAYLGTANDSAADQLDVLLSNTFPTDEPGAAVLIMRGDSVIFDRGYGLSRLPVEGNDMQGRVSGWDGSANLKADNLINGNTSFNIASCSKQFTAVAVLQLADKGLLDLHAPLQTYLPEYTSHIWQRVTAAHLLSHSSGIPDKRGYLTREQRVNGNEQTAMEYLMWLDTLNFEPGTAYEYINPTYVLLSKLVERVSGTDFYDYVRIHIFEPAGMSRTGYFDRDRQSDIPDMAHGYEYGDLDGMAEEHEGQREAQQKNWYEYDFGEETFFATRPDGGIYTSTQELAKWERALSRALRSADDSSAASGAATDSQPLLSATALTDAMSPHTLVTGSQWSDYQNRPDTWYGYGWFIEPEKGVVYHTGDNGGFKAYIGRYPRLNMTVIILANRTDWDRYQLKTDIEKLLPSL